MTELADKNCVPCKGDTPPLEGTQLEELHRQVPEWELVEERYIQREFHFQNFLEALEFVNRVGEVAEEQRHHPDISFGWGRAEIKLLTHSINGLSENDFILAAKVDRLR